MKSQPTFKFKHKGWLSIIVFLLLALVASSDALAKKPPKPSPGPIVGTDNLVRWGNDDPSPGILEADHRFCTLTSLAADSSSGTYNCEMPGTLVFYDFANFHNEIAHSRSDDWRCTSPGSQYYIEPDLEYSFSWNGDCTSDSGCDVTVVNRFTDISVLGGPVVRVRYDPDLDRLTLEGYGRVSNTTANPFDSSQSITIDYMNVAFIGKKGKGKVLSLCRATPLHENFPVTFETIAIDD